MLRFSKGFLKENNTKIVTDYNGVSDAERIKNIRLRMEGKINPERNNSQVSNNNMIKENIYQNRTNAFKNIKKD